MRRSLLLTLTLTMVAALAGCTPGSSPDQSTSASASAVPSASASASLNPGEVLLPAAAELTGKSLRFWLGRPNDRVEGWYDAGSGLASLRQTRDGKRLETITAGAELYLLGVAPGGAILRVELARLPDSHGLVPLADPIAALRLITGVTQVQRTADGFEGRIDLTRVDPGPSPATQRIVAKFLGSAAGQGGAVPFTAKVDQQGRLTMFRATFPGADLGRDLEYEFTVVEVGGPVTVARPTGATVVDAPAGVYAP